SDELEDQWGRVENFALPHLRRLISGDRDAEGRHATKIVAALHYARSYAFEMMFRKIVEEHRSETLARIAVEEDTTETFVAQFGRPAASGELEALALAVWTERYEG